VPERVVIHATAEVSPSAVIGASTQIWNEAQVREGVRIGRHCILGKGVYLDTDVVVGDRVKLQVLASEKLAASRTATTANPLGRVGQGRRSGANRLQEMLALQPQRFLPRDVRNNHLTIGVLEFSEIVPDRWLHTGVIDADFSVSDTSL
jgi:NDP-sugar pyrophosphorylase family protein